MFQGCGHIKIHCRHPRVVPWQSLELCWELATLQWWQNRHLCNRYYMSWNERVNPWKFSALENWIFVYDSLTDLDVKSALDVALHNQAAYCFLFHSRPPMSALTAFCSASAVTRRSLQNWLTPIDPLTLCNIGLRDIFNGNQFDRSTLDLSSKVWCKQSFSAIF